MIAELREVFGRDVDLLSTQALRNPFRRHEILRTRARLYAASATGGQLSCRTIFKSPLKLTTDRIRNR
jgi:hypothetical protein